MLYQGTSSGKMRITQKIGDMDGVLIVTDGREMWMYMAMMKRYMKMPPNPAVLTDVTPAAHLGLAGNGKVVRSEQLDVDAEPRDCWVVENRSPRRPSSRAGSTKSAISNIRRSFPRHFRRQVHKSPWIPPRR